MFRVEQMVPIGSGAKRRVEDFHLSRYACYLIVQNADPEKPIVALGQTYFAAQTRQAELADDAERVYLRDQVSEHNKTLAASAYEAGVVTSQDFAIFTDHGYMCQRRAKNCQVRRPKVAIRLVDYDASLTTEERDAPRSVRSFMR